MTLDHALKALWAVTARDVAKLVRQRGRLLSALVRPALWLLVFAAGFQDIFGVSIIPPYETYITYQEYVLPGLIGIILLFNGMQSSLSIVYDREMGVMRLLLTAPLPRWYLLLSKLMAGTVMGIIQTYAFLLVAAIFGIRFPWAGWLTILPALVLGGLMLGALGLLLSMTIRQLENFAGTMNFVIFPMFFISSALYPLWKLREAGADVVWNIARVNPFTYVVELVRFSAYGQFSPIAAAVVAGCAAAFFLAAAYGYGQRRSVLVRSFRPA